MLLATVVLVIGLSGTKLTMGNVELKGMALATIVGVLLSLFFKLIQVLGWSNEKEEAAHKAD
ncbi:hypothetical protein HMSSN036_95030 [Paenibacillus macerans]|nr:hypothetical protein HMSSN036_95030 [Paenibacillus macerans]